MTGVLAGRVAVVTGGASGIGRATVLRFLDAGARVVFGDLNESSSEALVAEVRDPARLRYVPTDVCVESHVAALTEKAALAFGRLDVMFNNAGLGGAYGPLTDIDTEDWDRTFAVISRGAFLGTKHAARLIDTPMVMGRDPAAITGRLATFQPWPDLGRPEHIASIALFLAGSDSEFVTGEAIRADGGMLAWGPRMEGAHDQSGVTRRHSGFSYGSTGRPAIKRAANGDRPS
jgi:NAD(P)-dependent dehydrogenase (short-subunit alcohol dehydrogenase family)